MENIEINPYLVKSIGPVDGDPLHRRNRYILDIGIYLGVKSPLLLEQDICRNLSIM